MVISRFIAASGFLRFWLYGSDLEKLEKPALPCLMTAVTLQASSTSGPVPVMSSASQETGGARVALSAYINITFFFFLECSIFFIILKLSNPHMPLQKI